MNRAFCIYMGHRRPPGGCEIYRGNLPLYHLAQYAVDWQTSWEYFEDVWEAGRRAGPKFWLDLIRSTNLLIFPRLVIPDDERARQSLADLFHVARSLGTRIVYETDDDYTGEFRQVGEGDTMSAAQWADAITVTTPLLADLMRRRTGRPVHVLPNCISPGDFREGSAPPRAPGKHDNIVIALTGSESHREDWRVLESIFPIVLREFPQVHLLIMGYQPDYLRGLPNTTYAGGARYDQYARVLRGCDVILAPVDPLDGFNLGKSPIKAIEGMAAQRLLPDGTPAGAAVLATDHPVYRLAIQHGKTGWLVDHTPEGWLDALRVLLTNEERRRDLQARGFQWVYKHHDITQEWTQWAKAYHRILQAPANPLLLPTTLGKGTPS